MTWLDYGEARFILALLCLVVSSLFLTIHLIDESTWKQVIGWILMLYSAHSLLDDKLPDKRLPPGS